MDQIIKMAEKEIQEENEQRTSAWEDIGYAK